MSANATGAPGAPLIGPTALCPRCTQSLESFGSVTRACRHPTARGARADSLKSRTAQGLLTNFAFTHQREQVATPIFLPGSPVSPPYRLFVFCTVFWRFLRRGEPSQSIRPNPCFSDGNRCHAGQEFTVEAYCSPSLQTGRRRSCGCCMRREGRRSPSIFAFLPGLAHMD